MRSPYDILGVAATASEDELRRAFRKLAKKLHPDMNPGNAEAEARFKEINAAYDLLSDPVKRARFDRGEIDAEGRETFSHAYANAHGGADPFRAGGARGAYHFSFGGDPFGGSEDAEDLFGHLFGDRFGAAKRKRGRDVRHSLTVDFLDAALGAVKRVELGGRVLDLTIPAGLNDGQTLRLKGQGGNGGDLLIEVRVAPHRLFTRKGDDLHVELPVTLGEAVNGGKVAVPTLTGRVAVSVPPGSSSGKVLRLKGKGIKGADLYVTLKLVLPERIDAELAGVIARWSAAHPYDPRAGM